MAEPGTPPSQQDPRDRPSMPRPTGSGPGRLLVAVYGLFTLAAVSRSAVQIATSFDQAPLAYLLSGLAGLIYLVATVSLARTGPIWRRAAGVAIGIELAGVLLVGVASLVDPAAFPDASVWSGFGSGYGFVPLVLPFVGLPGCAAPADRSAEAHRRPGGGSTAGANLPITRA